MRSQCESKIDNENALLVQRRIAMHTCKASYLYLNTLKLKCVKGLSFSTIIIIRLTSYKRYRRVYVTVKVNAASVHAPLLRDNAS